MYHSNRLAALYLQVSVPVSPGLPLWTDETILSRSSFISLFFSSGYCRIVISVLGVLSLDQLNRYTYIFGLRPYDLCLDWYSMAWLRRRLPPGIHEPLRYSKLMADTRTPWKQTHLYSGLLSGHRAVTHGKHWYWSFRTPMAAWCLKTCIQLSREALEAITHEKLSFRHQSNCHSPEMQKDQSCFGHSIL